MVVITNLCGNAHAKNFPCRECEYLARKNAASADDQIPVEAEPDVEPQPELDGAKPPIAEIVDASPTRTGRFETAKRALTRAEISRRQREKDPEGYRSRNRERMRAKRAK